MAPLKAWCSGVFNPVKNCFNAVKLCITEWSQMFVVWLFREFIPFFLPVLKLIKMVGLKVLIVIMFTKGLMLNVALPIADMGSDVKFAYDMHASYILYNK